MEQEVGHLPVMLEEVILALSPHPGSFQIDATVGGGGHAVRILEAATPGGRLLGIDADPITFEMSWQWVNEVFVEIWLPLMLGCTLLDGQGRVLHFGGEVMKNVAGYDLSRLMAGAQGTLGVLLEVSIKVLPAPAVERNLVLNLPRDRAVNVMRELARQPAPLSGACHLEDRLYLRLSGNAASVKAWEQQIGGDGGEGGSFWQQLKNQTEHQ